MCRSQTRFSGQLKKLHDSFCDWQIARKDVSCTLTTFERLLEENDFVIVRADGTYLVSGLELRLFIQAHEQFEEFLKQSGDRA